MRARKIVKPEEIFTEASVCRILSDAKVGGQIDVEKLRKGLIDAAERFASAIAHDGHRLHREIAALHAAAQNRRFPAARVALTGLSHEARDILNQREHPRLVRLPAPCDLLDPANREKACEAIIARCEIGGRWVPGRKRPTGRRSKTWKPLLCAPEVKEHPEKLAPERDFVMWAQVAFAEGTGQSVPVTARRDNLGPFARLAQEALRLIGSGHANAVELINSLDRTRREAESEVEIIIEPVTSQHMKDPSDDDD